ncbi:hypothetical protein SVAN01_08342 [Stagonosporopsis vannaccii]|nr:hypothetical protein SVAN01_08342 [Stagonosporopsis vannaccii]
MSRPWRQHRAARQLGAINNILQSQSPAPRHNYETRLCCGEGPASQRAKLLGRVMRDERPQQSQHSKSNSRSTFDNQETNRLRLAPHTPRLDRSLTKTREQRHSHSLRQRQHRVADGHRSRAPTPVMERQQPETPFLTSDRNIVNSSKSAKRQRGAKDIEDDQESKQAKKKRYATSSGTRHRGQSSSQTSDNTPDGDNKAATFTTISQLKSRPRSVPATPVQFMTPPSRNVTPERESHDSDSQELVSTTENKEQAGEAVPMSMEITYRTPRRNQRHETEPAVEMCKRRRQMKVVTMTDPKHGSFPASANTKRARDVVEHKTQTVASPVRQVQAQVVRPESFFAPVTPNHECDLKFRDYFHNSVPILYSSMIQHADGSELLTSPSEMLVLDAVTAIEASSMPHKKPGWSTATELLRRSPTNSHLTRVIKDVDLYLFKSETENQLHVATDRGLLLVTEYLKLIGVPEAQPVRFEGRVPPWAKAALLAREKRRVVHTWGKLKVVQEGTSLGSHQIALSLENHVEVRGQRDKEMLADTLQKSERKSTANKLSGRDRQEQKIEKDATPQAKAPAGFIMERELRELEILEAEPGDLPLQTGSVLIVYKVDDDNVWAYGRLMGTNKTGRFPISGTCPLDWGLDRFTGTDESLRRPLVRSEDPIEKD